MSAFAYCLACNPPSAGKDFLWPKYPRSSSGNLQTPDLSIERSRLRGSQFDYCTGTRYTWNPGVQALLKPWVDSPSLCWASTRHLQRLRLCYDHHETSSYDSLCVIRLFGSLRLPICTELFKIAKAEKYFIYC